MTITHSKGSNAFGDGWDHIFGNKKKVATKAEPATAKKAAKKAAKKSPATPAKAAKKAKATTPSAAKKPSPKKAAKKK